MKQTLKNIWNDKNFQPIKWFVLFFVVSVFVGWLIYKALNPGATFF